MALSSQETCASLGFKPHASPHERGPATLHGLTHSEVEEVIGTIPNHSITHLRYIDVDGERGQLSGYVEAEHFDAICRALGVQL